MRNAIFCLVLCSCASTVVRNRYSFVPCLSESVPERVKIETIKEPEPFRYLDEDGNKQIAYQMTVDPESMVKFFNYIETLEKIAKKSEGCREVTQSNK